jgi:hypothetical protein
MVSTFREIDIRSRWFLNLSPSPSKTFFNLFYYIFKNPNRNSKLPVLKERKSNFISDFLPFSKKLNYDFVLIKKSSLQEIEKKLALFFSLCIGFPT